MSINGDTTADYSPPVGSNFNYSTVMPVSLPTAGQTTFNVVIGDVVNTPDGDNTNDVLVIEYRARVIENTLPLSPQNPSTTLTNTATLQYIDGDMPPNTITRSDTASITVYQPVMTVPTKTDRSGRTSIANVQVGIDTMNFRLESCNTTGLSPAYNVKLTDQLDSELDETSITAPVVTINGALAVAGVDYTYTAPAARGGFMQFDLITAVDPNQCVRIDYDIGFYLDFPINQLWYNTVTVDEYWSLPNTAGQKYAALGPTSFGMTNNDPSPPTIKSIVKPGKW